MSNIDQVLTADLASHGAPRLVMTTDKMNTVYLDDGDEVRPLNGIMYTWVDFAADATQVALGTLPANSAVLDCIFYTTVVFNAGTTNTIAVGIAADPDLVADETEVPAIGTYVLTRGAAEEGWHASERDLVVTYNQSGGAATTGRGLLVLRWQRFPATN